MNLSTRTWIPCLVVLLSAVAAAGTGCALIFPAPLSSSLAQSPPPPPMTSRDVIELEVYFVDRRIGDPQIGESLWESLHEVTAIDPELRDRLRSDGFRAAMSSSRPPKPLQSLTSLSSETDPGRRAVRRRYTLPTGQETYLLTSVLAGAAAVQRRVDGDLQEMELQDAKCLLRLQAERIEEGWVKLVLVPEVRHGTFALRARPQDQEWLFDEGQNTISLYENRLTAELNVGEILVLGLAPSPKGSLGRHFFRGDETQGIERLVLIRVADMRKVEPVRARPQ